MYPKAYLYRRVVQSKLFIDEHYADDIEVGSVSDQAFFSKFHFIRLFKQIYGKTPHQYLSHVRIDRARHLLEQGSSVTQACFAVGFNSVTSFSGLFKKVVGLSPLMYQRRKVDLNKVVSTDPLRFIPGCFAGNDPSNEISNSREAHE